MTGQKGASGTTNNFISIQTMIERLEYVRNKLRDFWEQELTLLQHSLGFQEPARIQFDIMTLNDENAKKKLLLDMWDRNLISDEAIVEVFQEFPEIELVRQRREQRERKRKLRLEKAGPYFQAEKMHEYLKIALQNGYINPRDVEIEVQSDEPTPFDQQLKSAEKIKSMGGTSLTKKSKGVSGQGRPKNSKDSSTRKSRGFKVRTSAEQADNVGDFLTKSMWAKSAYNDISEHINPIMLKYYDKANLRQLSVEEADKLEQVKFSVLSNLDPYSNISEDKVVELITSRCKLSSQFKVLYDKLAARAYDLHGREPSMDERKSIQQCVYALLK
jgi:hypothetical protein